jgi:urea transport system permease protein
MKSWLTAAYPDLWLFALGAVFIGVTLFMPQGVVGLLGWRKNKKAAAEGAIADEAADPPPVVTAVVPEINEKNLPSQA